MQPSYEKMLISSLYPDNFLTVWIPNSGQGVGSEHTFLCGSFIVWGNNE